MNIRTALRQLRLHLGNISQHELALTLGVSKDTIGNAERNNKPLAGKVLGRLNEKYGLMLPSMGLELADFIKTDSTDEAQEAQDGP